MFLWEGVLFLAGYSGLGGNLGFLPGIVAVPAACLGGAALGNVANALIGDTAIDYKGSFMIGAYAFGGAMLGGFAGGSLGMDPVLIQSAAGGLGGLIGCGLGGISSYF